MHAPGKRTTGIFVILMLIIFSTAAMGQSMLVTWDENQERDLNGYNLYYGTSSGNYYEPINVGKTTSHTINNLTEGLTYFIAVTAYDSSGNESAFSQEVSIDIAPIDTEAPFITSITVNDERNLDLTYSEEMDRSSVENISNYQINPEITINSIILDPNQRTVHIITNQHIPGSYTLTVNNVFDKALTPNEIQPNSQISYEIHDTSPPTLTNVSVTNEHSLDVNFSERISASSAENINNYTIDGDVEVVNAQIDINGSTVHLETTEHSEGIHTIVVNNIYDVAEPPNKIIDNASAEYEIIDTTAPEIVQVEINNEQSIHVVYSEPVNQNSAELLSNYTINNGIEIIAARLNEDLKTVNLTTSQHVEGTYLLTVNNIKDLAGVPNTIAQNTTFEYLYVDTTPPTIELFTILGETNIDVTFSEPVEETSAENISNYQITPAIEVVSAELDENTRTVHLSTTPHLEGEYSISIGNIKDRAAAPNVIAPNSSIVYEYIDQISPTILEVQAITENQVIVHFSETMDRVSAESPSNYAINQGIQINQATLDATSRFVTLATSSHQESQYTITINNVKDQASQPNLIADGSSFAYEYWDTTPPTITEIAMTAENELMLVFSEPIESESAELTANYILSPGINLIQAVLDPDLVTVTLTTSSHEEGSYSLTVSNIRDRATTSNPIAEGTILNYEYIDTTPPEIINAIALSDSQVKLLFSEEILESSAETITNYHISGDIVISDAILDATGESVIISTSVHSEGAYRITVNNIKDNANSPNSIVNNSYLDYQYVDTTPPFVLFAEAVEPNLVIVRFNESVQENNAEEPANYQINGGINIYQALLEANGHTVQLSTSVHTEGEYQLVASNIKDRANSPNTIAPNISIPYQYIDRIPPFITAINAPSENRVDITFSEELDRTSAENVLNYNLSDGITINSALLDENNITVHLETSNHVPGYYSATINNVKDNSSQNNEILPGTQHPYEYIDLTPPTVENVEALDENHVIVTFSETVSELSAENVDNYQSTGGVSVTSAELDVDNKTVRLTTTLHVPGSYTLRVANILDRAVNPNIMTEAISISYNYIDRTPPHITEVLAINENSVEVTFSEDIERLSAENISNYSISGGVVVNSASLNGINRTVFLQTSAHSPGPYTITINNIKDVAENPNTITENSSYSYEYLDNTPPSISEIEALDENHVDLTFSEAVEKASAENSTNYFISEGISIESITLDGNNTTVHILTSSHTPGIYQIVVNNVKDRAILPNTIFPNSSAEYEYIDRTSPEITNVSSLVENDVDITFSEPVERASAENTDNYSINGGINVYSATLDDNEKVVHLSTSSHNPGQYTLVVNNIKDQAVNPNTIMPNSTFSYQYVDLTPPEISNIEAIDENHVDVLYSELVDGATAETISNYSISGGIEIVSVALDESGNLVHLTTSAHIPGSYTLSASNITDRATNPNAILPGSQFVYEYIDRTPPEISDVISLDEIHVNIQFSELVEKISAENIANYSIDNGIQIFSASLNETGDLVQLTTSTHTPGQYLLTINNVRDRAASPNTISPGSQFNYVYIDQTPPTLKDVVAAYEDSVDIIFSEAIDKGSAENISNYHIDNGVEILQASLDQNAEIVHLKTSIHQEGIFHITVNNIKDIAEIPNVISQNTTREYEYIDTSPPEIIEAVAISENQIEVTYSEKIEELSAETIANYSINGNITVSQAVLNPSEESVILHTSIHSEGSYRLTVNNVKDLAAAPNSIAPGSFIDYEFNDTSAPEISTVNAPVGDRVEVTFSEPVESASAENLNNYSINNGIDIYQAVLAENNLTVLLSTSEHDEALYLITANNIKDRASVPNTIEPNSSQEYQYTDTTPPEIVQVNAPIENHVIVEFSETINRSDAENISNYSINGGITILQANLDETSKIVNLTTTSHIEADYTITIQNVRDSANNPNTIQQGSFFDYEYIDTTKPVILNSTASAENQVKVEFSEPVEKLSAETISNYQINPGITIHQATLTENQRTIQLTTSAHGESVYTIYINNVKDRANSPNTIADNSSAQYQFIDTTPPDIVNIQAVKEDSVIITFSESVDRTSSEDVSNYYINETINILSASRQDDGLTVSLTTSPHEEGNYSLTVNNVKDQASTPNTIEPNSTFGYDYLDTFAPQISSVTVLSNDLLDITFNEPVSQTSAENLANYSISGGITVNNAELDQNQTTVHLTTSFHNEGAYSVSVSNVFDRATSPNKITDGATKNYNYVDTISPVIVTASAPGSNMVEIIFSEPVEKISSEDISNYSISGEILITAAELADDTLTVRLTTTSHIEGSYTLTVNNVKDRAQTPNSILPGSTFQYSYTDETRPTILNATTVDQNHIDVIFSENVVAASAENIGNYSINNGIIINQALLDNDGQTVHLSTSTHQSGYYIIIIDNIIDLAENPNTILPHSYFSYQYLDGTPPNVLMIEVLDATHVDITFDEKVDKTTSESLENFKITNVSHLDQEALYFDNKDQLHGGNDPIFDNDGNDIPSRDVGVVQLSLDSNERTVHLQTEEHQAGEYMLNISNLKDKANNTIDSLNVLYHFKDTIPPIATDVMSIDRNQIDVVFSEPVEQNSATNIENYHIDKNIQILNAVIIRKLNIVHLTTTDHKSGDTYNLTINGVTDMAKKPNTIAPNSIVQYTFIDRNPEQPNKIDLLSVTNDGMGGLILEWEQSGETNITGYKIYYGTEPQNYHTTLDAGNVTQKSIPNLIDGIEYYFALTCYNNYGQESDFSNELSATVEVIDVTPPDINAVTAMNDTEVVIIFSEKINKAIAELDSNYIISPGIRVNSAVLHSNGVMVRLNTTPHLPGDYEIKIQNIQDLAPNPNVITENASAHYAYYPNDQIAPYVQSFTIVSSTNIKINFSEYLNKEAAETTNNYQINNNIIVQSAVLDSTKQIVNLYTSEHQTGLNYLLTLNGIVDCALPPNFINQDTKLQYTYIESDPQPPELYFVRAIAENMLEINFSERIQRTDAENLNNYFINNNINVLSAELNENHKSVILETSPHVPELTYVISAQNIHDFAVPQNSIGENNSYKYYYQPNDFDSPMIISASAVNESQVDVLFTEYLDRFSAENLANYQISKNISIIEARLDNEPNIVHLTTSSHISGENYQLSISGIKDISPNQNIIANESTIEYEYLYTDREPPFVESWSLDNATCLKLNFNEIIERASAENLSNFNFNGNIALMDAILDSSLKTITLITSEHLDGVSYKLKISNLRDRAEQPNVLVQDIEIDYKYWSDSPIFSSSLTPQNYQVDFLTVGDPYYIDRNYEINKIPEGLANCLWIKTAQEDFQDTSSTFLTFQLKDSAKVFVGFDSQSANYPDWLVNNFFRIGKKLEVAGSANGLDLWQMDKQSEIITLGGNSSPGAENVNSMYVVLVQSQSTGYLALPDGMDDPKNIEVVQNYQLFQNYPNPFNSSTRIRYDLAEDGFVEIKIFNVLGQVVKTLVSRQESTGRYLLQWNGINSNGSCVSSGVYFIRMTVRTTKSSKKDNAIYSKVRKLVYVK